jgi:hypothetical protein
MKLSLRAVVICLVSLSGCGDKSYDKISTTRVRPPVQESLPAALLANGSFGIVTLETDYSKTCQTDASLGDLCSAYAGGKRLRCIVKNRLFCKGPTEVLSLLNSVDGRLEEIEKRSGEGEVDCINATPVDLTSQITYPGAKTLPGKFQCKDSAIGLGFGQVDGTWYVRESNGAAAQAFEIAATGLVRGYIWLPSADGTMAQSTGMLQVRALPSAKVMELTGGGVGFGFCGLHLKANATHLYIKMNPDGVGKSCDYTTDGATNASDWVEGCMDAATLDDVDASLCASLKSFDLTTLGRDESSAANSSEKWASAAPLPSGTMDKFELKDYLLGIYTAAGKFEGVQEFKAQN